MRLTALLLALSLTGGIGCALTPAQAQETDPHLRTIRYDPKRVIPLEGAAGYQLMIELSPDERVQNVALGDSAAWQVNVSKSGDHIFLKPQQAGAQTNMTVLTSVRTYNFELTAAGAPTADTPYSVRFDYAAPRQATSRTDVFVSPTSYYRIRGDKVLQPSLVHDDGTRTYLEWPPNRPLPAVFGVDETGHEILVDGMMRDDVMVIDRVVPRLIFRIDDRVARADREPRRKAR